MIRRALTDAHWAIIEPFCLEKHTDPDQTGGAPRLFMEAILWIVRTGTQWRELPAEYGHPPARTASSADEKPAIHVDRSACHVSGVDGGKVGGGGGHFLGSAHTP